MIIGDKYIISSIISLKDMIRIINNNIIHSVIFEDNLIDYFISIMNMLPNKADYYIQLKISKLYDLEILSKIKNKNVNVKVLYGNEDVSIDTYINTCNKLDTLVEPIKDSTLSPFEKFIYVFNVASKFRKYKYKKGFEDKSGSIFELFEEDNDLIVCLGFSKLLEELCKRVNINVRKLYISLCENMNEHKEEYHVRNIGRIVDPKYNLDGIYIFDSTTSNDIENDIYVTAAMTPLESLNTYCDNVKFGTYIDILSAQNYDEFIHVISKDSSNNYKKFDDSINILLILYPEVNNILTSYNNLKNIDNPNKDDYYKLFTDEEFMQNLFDFIYDKCNKKISGTTIVDAACNVKRVLEPNISASELELFRKILLETNHNFYDDLYLYVEEYDDMDVLKYIDNRKNTYK